MSDMESPSMKLLKTLILFHMGGGMMAPQNVFYHCAQTLRTRKLKLADF